MFSSRFLLLAAVSAPSLMAACSSRVESTDPEGTVTERISTGGGSITSSDGRMTFVIPPNALNGQADITVVTLEESALPPELSGFDTEAAYSIESTRDLLRAVEFEYQTGSVALRAGGSVDLLFALVPVSGAAVLPTDVALTTDSSGAGDLTGRFFLITVEGGSAAMAQTVSAARAGVSVSATGIPETLAVGGMFEVTATVATGASSPAESGLIRYQDQTNPSEGLPLVYLGKSDTIDFPGTLTPLTSQALQVVTDSYTCLAECAGVQCNPLSVGIEFQDLRFEELATPRGYRYEASRTVTCVTGSAR